MNPHVIGVNLVVCIKSFTGRRPRYSSRLRSRSSWGGSKIIPVDPTINAAQYARDMTLDLVLVIRSGYQGAFVQRLGLIGGVPTAAFRDADASVTVTYVYDASSISVFARMQMLQSTLGW